MNKKHRAGMRKISKISHCNLHVLCDNKFIQSFRQILQLWFFLIIKIVSFDLDSRSSFTVIVGIKLK